MAISEAQQRAVAKYNAANYERVELRLKKGKKTLLKAHAQTHGESLNEFVNRAIDETLERDRVKPTLAAKSDRIEGGSSDGNQ